MSGSMDITTTSDNAESPDASAAAPTKPSPRILDQALTNLTTREQDLAHGPLLLGFGDGQGYVQDHHPSDLGLELASEESAHDSANESIPPSLHWGVPLSSSAHAMTQSTISRSGPSLTLPSGSIKHETVYDPEEKTTPPPPWHHEFSWENSHLCFDSEPLEIAKVLGEQFSEANPTSESKYPASRASFSRLPAPLSGAGGSDPFSTIGIGGFVSSAEGWPTLSLPQDFEVASMGSSAFSDSSELDSTMGDDYIEESSDPMVAIAMEKRAEWLAEVLFDDFFRSYAGQRSRKRTAAAEDLPSEAGNKAQSFGGDRGHAKRPRKSRVAGRSEGSGDEDSGGDGQGPSRAAKYSDSKYLACPFLKWNPMRHQQTYCPKCEIIFKQTNIPTHACNPNRVRPRGHMTEAKLLQIEAIRGSEVEWKKKQQWERFYEILFPNEPPCLSPYFNKAADRGLAEAERYMRLPEAGFSALLFSVILPEVWERYGINDEGEPYMTHDKEHAAQHAQSSKTVNSGARDTIISHDTGNDASQYPHDGIAIPQSCAVTGSTDYPASMPELFAAQEQSGNIASDFSPDLTNSGEFSDPARRGLMGICGSGNWEMSVVQNLTDPSWSAGYEVRSDLMSEP
ncbi:uncharacterized protein FTOL_07321 [Fusarium torulosum]|uniref:Uncharacterized protein n=1 Tax=Fusarium torulosum TaxID=33205 RepID=A0AAE8MAV7_9HYPO|nr:uncharacterized protein FTOL_07321 [Fusarium torulosum]